MKAFTLLLETRCNNFCVFCGNRAVDAPMVRVRQRLGLTVPKRREGRTSSLHVVDVADYEEDPKPRFTLQGALDELRLARENGFDRLSLQGGEPTLWPWIVELIEQARAMGFVEVVTVTNGQLLARAAFAEALVRAGLNGITFSFLGSTALVHDTMTVVPKSFEKLCAAVRNCRRLVDEDGIQLHLDAAFVTSGANVEQLPEFVDLAHGLGLSSAHIQLVRYDFFGDDDTVKEWLRFPLEGIRKPAADALERSAATGFRLHFDDPPACMLPRLRPDEASRWKRVRDTEKHTFAGPDFDYTPGEKKLMRAADCAGCVLQKGCLYVPAEYLPRTGSPFEAVTVATLRAQIEAVGGGPGAAARLAEDVEVLGILTGEGVLGDADFSSEIEAAWGRTLAWAVAHEDGEELRQAWYGLLGLWPPHHGDRDPMSRTGDAMKRALRDPYSILRSGDPPVPLADAAALTHLLHFGGGWRLGLQLEAVDGGLRAVGVLPLPGRSPGLHRRLAMYLFVSFQGLRMAWSEALRVDGSRVELDRGDGLALAWRARVPGAIRLEARPVDARPSEAVVP
jgi:MoaA/NifB/PqqE/SkfB family radical SAM enzyme